MEPVKYKSKDTATQNILDEIYRNALGVPIISENTPTKDTIKPNVLTFNGTDAYIKLPDGRLIKLPGTLVT